LFWDKQLLLMVQGYFEDMKNVLSLLLSHAAAKAQVWFIVSNSAYYGIEIPVDLIIAEIGSKVGWNLNRIEVVRKIPKRISKNSSEIKELRESIIIFES
jgi:hypothetical protein